MVWLIASARVFAQGASVYHTNRIFEACISSFPGLTSAYQVISQARLLTELVGPTNVMLDMANTRATEYESGAWGYESAQAAWTSAVASYASHATAHEHAVFDNVGWVKGAMAADGTWGAYFWYMQNQIAFRSSATNAWISLGGVTGYFARVHVGSLGDYAPMADYTDIGPTNWAAITNFPGSGNWTEAVFRADLDTYYQLLMTQFREDTQQLYGFDFFSDPKVFYKSVETGKTDTVLTEIAATDYFAEVHFRSTNTLVATVTPSGAASATQTLSIVGGVPGGSEIHANGGFVDGPRTGRLKVLCYPKIRKTVAIRTIHEANDDEQLREFGTGGWAEGEAVVGPGSNGFLDTIAAPGDYELNGFIRAGYNGIVDTHASSGNRLGPSVNADAVRAYLNARVYNQVVLEWSLVELPARAVNFDLDRDGAFQNSPWGASAEVDTVLEEADDLNYDFIVFLLDFPLLSTSMGDAYPGERAAFVYPRDHQYPQALIAHELGHAAFSLGDRFTPAAIQNLMSRGDRCKWRLNHEQWQQIRAAP